MNDRRRAVRTGIGRAVCQRGRAHPGEANEPIWASVIVTPVGITPIRSLGPTSVWGNESIARGRRIA